MRKNTMLFCIITIAVISSTMVAFGDTLDVKRTQSNIYVDNTQTEIDSYNINGNNYFKLRDLAFLLKDTHKMFSVNWNDKSGTINLITRSPYITVGGEMSIAEAGQIKCIESPSRIYVNNREVQLKAYNINGNNYFKLRDLGENLNFGVGWNGKSNKILISSSNNYYDMNPISPSKYQNLLGKGMDVDWSKTEEGRANYSIITVKQFVESNVKHVRIRIKDDADEKLFNSLDKQIDDCIEAGLIPVIAYQADEFKNKPTEENIKKVVKWWSKIAERYKDKSYFLSFDLLIESTDELNKQPEKLNEIYERLVTQIRKTNPNRIIIMSPRLRSNPEYLNELEIPTMHNGYMMAEWHFYASGPSKTNDEKLWTTGTEYEKTLILEKIKTACEWQKETGIPTWVGALMPGNYNDGNDYTIEEQVAFADFMTKSLTDANIPFAVNSDTKFYNREDKKWVENMQPVFHTIYK
ncbi:MAG: cellulase family glycosylhydrolase [Aminipila sp.]